MTIAAWIIVTVCALVLLVYCMILARQVRHLRGRLSSMLRLLKNIHG